MLPRAARAAADSEDKMDTQLIIPDTLYQATQNLAENLVASEPFVRYFQAHQAFEADSEAQFLLKDISGIQGEIRKKQQRGQVTQADLDVLRTLQTQAQSSETLMQYANTQQEAVSFLREINQEISQLLGMDFAALSRKTGCC
jgi:cell fate (sporulation/competence/biofilm development) regulator YlbF (YheA/YmcA/DUF963 family)